MTKQATTISIFGIPDNTEISAQVIYRDQDVNLLAGCKCGLFSMQKLG